MLESDRAHRRSDAFLAQSQEAKENTWAPSCIVGKYIFDMLLILRVVG
jgi:hypothetical protein